MIINDNALHRKYTFVTVVFGFEYSLLLVQARSMQLYCPLDLVEAIIVIDNSDSALFASRWKSRLLDAYGRLADFVRFVSSREIATVPQGVGGYSSQQLLKLMVSLIIHTERYIILDAKNHLVFPLKRSFLETSDGRACISFHSYIDYVFRPDLERVLTYLELDSTLYIEHFAMCSTPFIMYTNIVRELIKDLSIREKMPFERLFIQKNLLEFFLYMGFMLMRGMELDELYFDHQVFWPTVCSDHRTSECVREVAMAIETNKPFFSVHRRAIGRLSAHSRHSIANFWCSRMLFESTNSAERFLIILQMKVLAAAMKRRLVSLLEPA